MLSHGGLAPHSSHNVWADLGQFGAEMYVYCIYLCSFQADRGLVMCAGAKMVLMQIWLRRSGASLCCSRGSRFKMFVGRGGGADRIRRAIHGTLDELQATDVSSHRSIAPRLLKSGQQSASRDKHDSRQ